MTIFNSYVNGVTKRKVIISKSFKNRHSYEAKYSAKDIAVFFYNSNVSISNQKKIIEYLWKNRRDMIYLSNPSTKNLFVDQVNQEIDRLVYNKNKNSYEFINRLLEEMDSEFCLEESDQNLNSIYLVLKQKRLKLQFISKREYISMKLRSLLKEMGYKRRNNVLNKKLN